MELCPCNSSPRAYYTCVEYLENHHTCIWIKVRPKCCRKKVCHDLEIIGKSTFTQISANIGVFAKVSRCSLPLNKITGVEYFSYLQITATLGWIA